MAKRLTHYILGGLVLGIVAGWAINAAIADGTPEATEHLKTSPTISPSSRPLFLHLIKMIIAPLVFSTLVVGIAHMGDTAALGRVGLQGAGLVHRRQPRLADARPAAGQPASAGRRAEPAAPAGRRRERRRDRSAFDSPSFITHIFPASIFEAMAKNEILQIVIFSLFFGVALTAVGEQAKPLVRASKRWSR